MARAGLLLPSEPLFIVDKSWTVPGTSKRGSKSKTDLFGKDDFKVLKAGKPQPQNTRRITFNPPQTFGPESIPTKDSFHFIAANEPGGRQDSNARKAVRKHARQHVTQSSSRDGAIRQAGTTRARTLSSTTTSLKEMQQEPDDGSPQLTMAQMIPDSTMSLYGNDNARDPIGLEKYLHYYREVIASGAYPLERHMNFEFNAIRGTCFPLALTDRLFLQTIMLVSAIHNSHINGAAEPKLTDALSQRVLEELRQRIAEKDVSDATLLSVSCIALLENTLGHHCQWRVHATGMKEMLRLRGGIDTVDMSIRWKIYRADMVGAVDHISKPLLPHPGIRMNLRDVCKRLGLRDDDFVATLSSSGMSHFLQNIFQHIYQVTSVTKYVIEQKIPVNTYFYDNSCLQIQHDLLQAETENALDETWRIAALIYMNTFTKSRPFAGVNCTLLSQTLRTSMKNALRTLTKKNHHLWLAFIGGLVSVETDDHDWFVQTLTHIVHTCGCTGWTEIREILNEVLWLDVLHEEAGLRLWKELAAFSSLATISTEA